MEDEEIDPLFADIDLPAVGSLSSFQDQFESHHQFGPGGDDFGEDSFEEHTAGPGIGRELFLGEELYSGDDSENNRVGGSYGREGSTGRALHDSSEASRSRMSLAFELASASESNGRGSSLLRELGLEEEEEDEPAEELEDEKGGHEPYERYEQAGGGREALVTTQEEEEAEEIQFDNRRRSPSSTDRTTQPRLRSKTSTVSLVDDTFDEQVLEKAFKEISTSLEESIHSIQTSLTHLRDNLHSSAPISDTSRPSVLQPGSPASYADRQSLAEASASSLVKALYSASKLREAQVRDVTEYERLVQRNGAGWETILSELEPIIFDEDDERQSRFPSPSQSPDRSNPNSRTNNLYEDILATSASPTSRTNGDTTSHLGAPCADSALAEVRQLRNLTSTILSAFVSISDIAQVQSALASDVGRKLRALRTQVAALSEELAQVDQSEAFISEFEDKVRIAGKRDYAEEVRVIMRGVEVELETSTLRARSILSVH